MGRTVKVALQAEVGQYKRGMGEAKRATEDLADAIDDVDGAPLDKAAGRAKFLGEAVESAADKAKREFAAVGRNAEDLDRKIHDTETGMRSLAKAFAATGDPKILAAWKQQGQVLGDLKNVRKLLPSPEEISKAGLSAGKRIGNSIVSAVPPQMSQAIFIGAAAGAPLAAAAIVGAITGGSALGGIGAGVTLSLKDPKIKAQAKDLGADIGSYLRTAASSFGEAMPDAIGKVRTLVGGLQGELTDVFTSSAGYLGPFLDQLAPGIEDIVSGLSRVVQKAGPTLAVIGDGLSGVLTQVARLMEMVASNSDTGAKALSDLFMIVEFGVSALTVSIDLLAKAYKYGLGWTALFTGADDAVNEFSVTEGKAAGTTNALGHEVEETGKKVEVARQKFVALEEILAKTAERNMSAAEANIAMRQATKDVTGAIDKKRRVTDAEMTALIAFARTANSATASLDEQGRTVASATKAHEANRRKLITTAMAMGKTEAEAKSLADQYLAMPKGVGTTVTQPGMVKSRAEIKAYHGQLDDLTRKIKTSVSVTGDAEAYAKLKTLLIAQQAASKGISVSAAKSAYNKQEAKAFHAGGWTGPGAKMQPAGTVHADEFVIKKESRRKIERTNPGLLDELNATGQVGYARGGLVMPVRVNASKTKVMSMEDALAKVTPAIPGGGSAMGPWIERAAKALVPGLRVLSRYRPGARTLSGNVSLHSSNDAVDFEPSKALARKWDAAYGSKTTEFISPFQQYNRLRGQRHSYTGAVWNQHNFAGGNAHDHIGIRRHRAMASGGVIQEPVVGVGRSGATYSFAERGPERVLSAGQTAASLSGAGPVTVTISAPITIQGGNQSAGQIAAAVDRKLGALVDRYSRGA